MVNISKLGDSTIKFTFTDNDRYLYNGEITLPLNSLILEFDTSDLVIFKKIDGDVFVTFLLGNSNFGSKDSLIEFYKANMVSSGGGGGGVTPEEVEAMIDEAISGITVSGVTEEELNEAIASAKTEIEAEIPTVPTSNTAFTNDAGYITSSALNGYATEDYVTASTSTKLDVSTFNTYSGNVESALNGKQPIGDYVTGSQMSAFTYDKATIDEKISEGGIFDPTQYYTTAQTYSKTETNSLLDDKLDASAYTPTDLSNYDTKSEVNTKIEQATSGKVDTSTFNVYSGNVASALDGKVDDAEIADMATKTWVGNQGYITEHQDISGKLDVSAFTAYSGAVDTTINSKASQASVDTLNGVVTAHTANTEIHVTSAEKNAWNAKSDFSGSYNDLTDKPTIPTVPTSNTAFTNDAGYITSGEAQTQIDNSISGKVDASTYTAYTAATDAALSGKADSSAVTEEISAAVSGKQDTLSAGRGISISSDTVSVSLPISAATGANSVKIGNPSNVASALFSYAEGSMTTASGFSSHAEGDQTLAYGDAAHAEGFATSAAAYSHAEGMQTSAYGQAAHAEGNRTLASGNSSHAEGTNTIANNQSEHASGQYNVSSSGSSTFGNSGNTLFSVGNGTANNARHNAFEIRQNGDIYLTSGSTDIKLQDYLGGGLDTDTERLLSTALVDLNDRKIDASEVKSNYQKKGDYATKSALDLKANASEVMTLDKSKENELVTAAALNSINDRLIALEAAVQALQALHNNG